MAGKLDGGKAIQSGTITTTQLTTALSDTISAGGGPKIKSLIYPGDDTAANTVGGQTIYIIGSGFDSNVAVYANGSAVPSVTYISASNVGFTTPALAAATYPLYVTNPDDGATAILVPGLQVSGEPTWVTGATLSEQDAAGTWNISLSATGDAPLTYALAAGSSLPSGISLASNGVISGTLSSPPETDTTYNFTVVATDAQNQDASRQFTVTVTTSEGVLFANNVLLIHADGTNNQNNHAFLDSSNNNFTITRNGNATQGSFSPFSQTGWSNYFDGAGDYLTTPVIGAGNGSGLYTSGSTFTVEAWLYQTTFQTTSGYVNNILGDLTPTTASALWWVIGTDHTNAPVFRWYDGAVKTYTGPTALGINRWNHVAFICNAGTLSMYVNGISQSATGTSTISTPTGTQSNLYIGADRGQYYTGYISNLRILKGTALYTTNFTPSTSSLTNIANTSLLTLQSNRFIDNSNNNFTITRNGDVSIQAWSPFAPSTAYSTANVGGSVYFDGTGDYLSIADDVALDAFTDFTIEGWVYFNSAADSQVIVSKGWDAASTFSPYILYTSSGGLVFTSSADGSSWGVLNASVIPNITVGRWYHFAVTRSGSTIRYFNNGALTGTSTLSAALMNSTHALTIGSHRTGGYYLNGYLSGLRIVKGTAVYTSAFTPPSAPLTNIANTSLLCNFTNAGIFDQTAKNVLECIGDAKVSTAQYKYGTGSMYFDGTGDRVHTGPSNPLIALGTGNFTVECWVNKLDTNHRGIWQISSTAGGLQASTSNLALGYQTGVWQIYRNGNSESASYSITPNTWYHTAVVRNSGTTKLYVNGTEVISVADTNNYTGTYMVIGGYYDTSYLHNGYIDDLRITRGYARYTSNFTAPTSAFKDK